MQTHRDAGTPGTHAHLPLPLLLDCPARDVARVPAPLLVRPIAASKLIPPSCNLRGFSPAAPCVVCAPGRSGGVHSGAPAPEEPARRVALALLQARRVHWPILLNAPAPSPVFPVLPAPPVLALFVLFSLLDLFSLLALFPQALPAPLAPALGALLSRGEQPAPLELLGPVFHRDLEFALPAPLLPRRQKWRHVLLCRKERLHAGRLAGSGAATRFSQRDSSKPRVRSDSFVLPRSRRKRPLCHRPGISSPAIPGAMPRFTPQATKQHVKRRVHAH